MTTMMLAALLVQAAATQAEVVRADHFVERGEERLFVREVSSGAPRTGLPPILLLHGARVPGVPSFDLPVPGGSLAADLAEAGHIVYVMDAIGYGRSTRPAVMDGPPQAHAPLARTNEIARDVHAVVEWIGQRRDAEQVAIVGWATGGLWAGYYASVHPERVSHLVVMNTLYGGSAEHPTLGAGSDLEDPRHPGRFNAEAFGAYRLSTAASLTPAWDRSIPIDDKSQWRDPAVVAAYEAAALESDSTATTRTPPSFRAPSGAMEDSYYLATGRQLWDASLVLAPTLIVRSGRDFWSRPVDAETLEAHLVHATRVERLDLPDSTHFVHLDRPERGRERLVSAIVRFLAAGE